MSLTRSSLQLPICWYTLYESFKTNTLILLPTGHFVIINKGDIAKWKIHSKGKVANYNQYTSSSTFFKGQKSWGMLFREKQLFLNLKTNGAINETEWLYLLTMNKKLQSRWEGYFVFLHHVSNVSTVQFRKQSQLIGESGGCEDFQMVLRLGEKYIFYILRSNGKNPMFPWISQQY